MKPLKLTMTAFGPYAKTTVLDFEHSLKDNIFVISGPTGAGKTTIFDAICYALYGDTSDNNRRSQTELRSHFATEHSERTSVELEFAVHGIRYYIKRMPQQQRKKLRGEGFTEEKHSVEFRKMVDDAVSKTRVEEVNEDIVGLLGLTLAQFKRIVMLPQGAFREFLQDNSSNKTELLRKLFDTDFYDKLTIRLQEKAKKHLERSKELESAIYTNLTHVICDADHELVQLIADRAPLDQIIAGFEALNAQARQSLTAGEAELSEQTQTVASMEELVQHLRERQAKVLERERLTTKLRELTAQNEAIVLMQQRQAAISAAQQNLDKDSLWQETLREMAQIQQALVTEEAAAAQLSTQQRTLNKELSELPQRQRQLQTQLLTLNKLGEYARKLEQIQVKQKNIEQYQQELQQQELWLKVSKVKQQYELVQTQMNLLRELYRITKSIVDYEQQLQTTELQQATLREQLNFQTQDLAHKQEIYIKAAAIGLAKELSPGQPCPVCGASEHPHPAPTDVRIPGKQELSEAAQAIKKLQKELSDTEKLLTRAQRELREQQKLQNESLRQAALQTFIVAAEPAQQLDQIQEMGINLAAKAKEAAAELAEYNVGPAEKIPDAEQLELRRQELQTAYSTENGQLALLVSEVPTEYQNGSVLRNELETVRSIVEREQSAIENVRLLHSNITVQLTAKTSNITNLRHNIELADTKKARLQQERELFLKEHFSDSSEAYEQALSEIPLLAGLNARIKHHAEELLICRTSLEKLPLFEQNSAEPDLETAVNNLIAKRQHLQELNVRLAMLTNGLARNRELLKTVQRDSAVRSELAEQYALLGSLAKMAGGANQSKMKLEAFVLSSYFDEILAKANVRMQKMSDNRYLLMRRQEISGGGYQGLELNVYDTHTCKERSVSTLSGGESFKAALSLALGLADVVQANAGGIRLDTMLIDEGFGTLDEESLDTAIDTLMELQEYGRIIGVISHVTALKNRIAAKLIVHRDVDGSYACFE